MNTSLINSLKEKKAVLITGTSSGIGNAIAVFLAKKGFLVFAGVRKESDEKKLKSLGFPNLIPTYPLDLTSLKDIRNISSFIDAQLSKNNIKGLFSIVNVAGLGSIAPIELLNLNSFENELKTRIIGPIALLQTFLPLIRKAKGRILWIATPALIPSPFLTDIHACDFAVNFLVRTLKIELLKWDIPGILIRCGGIKTSSPERTKIALEESTKNWSKEKYFLYKDALDKVMTELKSFDKKRTEPLEVAKTIYKVLTVKKPKRRYRVGYMSGFAAFLELLPQTLVDIILEKKYKL